MASSKQERALEAIKALLVLSPVLMVLLSAEAIMQFVGVISVGPVLTGLSLGLAVITGIAFRRLLRLRKRLIARGVWS